MALLVRHTQADEKRSAAIIREELRSLMRGRRVSEVVPTRIAAIDAVLPGGGLGRGMVHEWIGLCGDTRSTRPVRQARWSPALTLLIEMARSALGTAGAGRDRLVWIGHVVWPYPVALAAGGNQERPVSLDQCLFVDASRAPDRLWAADLALRSRAVAAVITDGSGFDLGATRRLQLAAEAGGGLCLLARAPRERGELSAAATRWAVSSRTSPTARQRWTVELLRCRGVMSGAPHVWTLERDHATRTLRVAPDLLDRPCETAAVRLIG